MTDRELLELAAKAAGYKVKQIYKGKDLSIYYNASGDTCFWNPLTDDGDALRLAVNLCFSIEQSTSVIEVTIGKELIYRFVALEKSNRLEATRRAIVRAAAEIGKGMK